MSDARPVEFTPPFAGNRPVYLSLTEPFFFAPRLGVVVGVILSSPVVVHQAWVFQSPAA
jgi:Sec-independent protein secretion pathway component TatC